MILLDDPVSAVDAGVGDAIFHEALEVELKDTTRVSIFLLLPFKNSTKI